MHRMYLRNETAAGRTEGSERGEGEHRAEVQSREAPLILCVRVHVCVCMREFMCIHARLYKGYIFSDRMTYNFHQIANELSDPKEFSESKLLLVNQLKL